jgi:hypothetical protein
MKRVITVTLEAPTHEALIEAERDFGRALMRNEIAMAAEGDTLRIYDPTEIDSPTKEFSWHATWVPMAGEPVLPKMRGKISSSDIRMEIDPTQWPGGWSETSLIAGPPLDIHSGIGNSDPLTETIKLPLTLLDDPAEVWVTGLKEPFELTSVAAAKEHEGRAELMELMEGIARHFMQHGRSIRLVPKCERCDFESGRCVDCGSWEPGKWAAHRKCIICGPFAAGACTICGSGHK